MSRGVPISVRRSRKPMVMIPGDLLLDRSISDRAYRLFGLIESIDNDAELTAEALALALGCTVAQVEAAVMELSPRWLTVVIG